jgi:hypothetical protein
MSTLIKILSNPHDHRNREARVKFRGARLWGPLAIAVAAIVMARWTWATWPDVLVDFGQQLYLAWRVSRGEVLYRDLAYYNGPLSVYLNAALFRLFGVGLWTLVWANLAVGVAVGVLLYRLFAGAGGRWSGPAAGLAFVLLFAFGQFVGVGNYNFVCPYAHEMTHGLVLSLAALALASRWGRVRFGFAGVALGLAFLTKSEVFLAGVSAVLVALIVSLARARLGREGTLRALALFGAGLHVPPLVAFVALSCQMPMRQALAGTLGSWVAAVNPAVVNLPFFRHGLGTDDVGRSLRLLALWSAGDAALFGALGVCAFAVPRRFRPIAAGVLFLAVLVVLGAGRRQLAWHDAARPLPVVLIGVAAACALRLWRRSPSDDDDRQGRRLALAVLGLMMLAKMVLFARLSHYGFVLAMPATLVFVAALVDWLPAAIARLGGSPTVFRAGAVAVLLVAASSYLFDIQAPLLRAKRTWVGTGVDRFLAGDRGVPINRALAEIDRRLGPAEQFAVLPEGVMLNYLSRRPTPTRYTVVLPTELALYGEPPILAALQSHSPDWLLLVDRDMEEPGLRFFGQDFARSIGRWAVADYRGLVEFTGRGFGIIVLRRVATMGATP